MIGVDEAGRGPVFGPMVICALAAPDDRHMKDIGVRDSKDISPQRREKLAATLSDTYEYELVILKASEIDEYRERMTLNQLEVEAFSKVLFRLLKRIEDKVTVYADSADVNEKRFSRDIQASLSSLLPDGKRDGVKIIAAHKADSTYPVVGAASIVAKVTRDREVKEIEKTLSPKMGGLPLGSGYPSDVRTVAFLKQYIKKHHSLPPNIRHSWKTIKNLKRRYSSILEGGKTLFDF